MNAPHALSLPLLRASWRHWLSMSAPEAGPRWLQLVWTAAFSSALAAVFTLLAFVTNAQATGQWMSLHSWLATFRANLVVSLTIGFVIQALFALARRVVGLPRIKALQGWRRWVFFVTPPVLGVALGWPIGALLLFGDTSFVHDMTEANVASMVVMSLLLFALISGAFALKYRQIAAEARANDAQLRLLQGQMEPHFLFNTLANVISLIDADAPRAKQVLEAFTEYLRASLGSLRREGSTLAGELDLATRYLQLMQTRMGERLRFEFDVAPVLGGAALPPLLLQPLVENAIKHGLEPKVAGGTVRVVARTIDAGGAPALQLCVEDDGIGLEAAAARARRPATRQAEGNGIALANLRERLQALFGTLASLTLTDLGHGTRACLVLPLRIAGGPAAADR